MRRFFVFLIIGVFAGGVSMALCGNASAQEKILILHEAKEMRTSNVAVSAYLVDDILEMTIHARMWGTQPNILTAVIVGPELNRLAYTTREYVYSKGTEEEDSFETIDVEGHHAVGERTKTKKLKGMLTKEYFQFKLPRDKFIPGEKYELKVHIESKKAGDQGKGRMRFKFDLPNLAELLHPENAM